MDNKTLHLTTVWKNTCRMCKTIVPVGQATPFWETNAHTTESTLYNDPPVGYTKCEDVGLRYKRAVQHASDYACAGPGCWTARWLHGLMVNGLTLRVMPKSPQGDQYPRGGAYTAPLPTSDFKDLWPKDALIVWNKDAE